MKDETDILLESRDRLWGNPELTWARVAQVWSGILGHEVTPQQAALCMAGMKAVRASICPDDTDSYDDAQGYLRIADRIIFGREAESLDAPVPFLPTVFEQVTADRPLLDVIIGGRTPERDEQ